MAVDRNQLIEEAQKREDARPKCMTCDHLDGPFLHDDVEDEEANMEDPFFFYGHCHEHSPTEGAQVVEDEDENLEWAPYVWPLVDCSEWCSKHKPRPLPESPVVKTPVS